MGSGCEKHNLRAEGGGGGAADLFPFIVGGGGGGAGIEGAFDAGGSYFREHQH